MAISNIDLNLQSLKEIQEENPATSHIYMRRDDGVMVDIPLGHAEFTIKNHPDWVVEGGAVPKIELAVSPAESALDELPILPPKPSEEMLSNDIPKVFEKSVQKEVESIQTTLIPEDKATQPKKKPPKPRPKKK